MAGFETGLDILTNVLSRADELAIGSADREDDAKIYIQTAYIAVLSEGYPWPFGRKNPPGVLTTLAEVTAGSIAVVNASATITFSVAPSVSLSGYKFFTDTDSVIYRISAHTATATTATLDSVFLGTSATAATYHCFQDEYALASDFLRPVSHKFLKPQGGYRKVELIGIDELEGITSNRMSWSGTDIPRYCAFIGDQRIRIWPWTTTRKRFEYLYAYHPGSLDFSGAGSGDTLIIQPAEDRVVVSLMAVGNLLVDKNDDRANIFLDAAVAKVNSMKRLAQTKSRARVWVSPNNNVSTVR